MRSTSSMAPYFLPAREPIRVCGARLIDSWPTATTMSASPLSIRSAPAATASMPERQTMLIVIAGTVSGIPAATAACRAGFWPEPPRITWPAKTRCTLVGGDPGPRQGGADGGHRRRRGLGGELAGELGERVRA